MLAAGGEVECLDADPAVAATFGEDVTILPAGALPSFADGAFVPGTFDLVELAAEELRRRRPRVAGSLVRISESEDVDRYLCRSLLREAGAFLALALLVSSPELARHGRVVVERHWPNGPDFAFLADVARTGRPGLPPAVSAAIERLAFEAEADPPLLRRLRSATHAARELTALWRDALALLRPAERRLPQRPLLIRSYAEDWGIDRGDQRRLRNLDFVVDGDTIDASEVAVWLEEGVPPDRRARLQERGYAVLERSDVTVGLLGFLWRVVPALLDAGLLFARLSAAERWWHGPVRRLLFQLILWREVARGARPRVLLALNDIHPTGVARTLALRRTGCLTVEYEFSSHWLTNEDGWVPDYVYGFTVVDAMVSWGPLHSRHFSNHRGVFGEFWELGCLWSEHARLVRDDEVIGRRYREALAREYDLDLSAWDAVVGVFDTSTASFFGYDDMAAFYAGVAAVAAASPRVLFLCKPKRPFADIVDNANGGAEVGAALAGAPNVVMLHEWFETAAVVGLCDLSINACYTSPAVETIGAGRPALYYDPTRLFPDSFFRRVDRFVATTEDELCTFVAQQLARDGRERETDLRERFSELEGHFDGRAITRLRGRLRAVLDG